LCACTQPCFGFCVAHVGNTTIEAWLENTRRSDAILKLADGTRSLTLSEVAAGIPDDGDSEQVTKLLVSQFKDMEEGRVGMPKGYAIALAGVVMELKRQTRQRVVNKVSRVYLNI
jgi:hypothetical protein